MEFFGFVFSTLALVIGTILLLALIVGCSLDRREQNASMKWWVFVAIGIMFTGWQFDGIRGAITDGGWIGFFLNPGFWKFVGLYALAGLVYSIIEFAIIIRKSRTYMAGVWSRFLVRWNKELAEQASGSQAQEFIDYYGSTSYAFVGLELKDGNVEPKLNRGRLSGYISTWTLFWPAYAISLIFGDLIAEIFNTAADFLASISGRAVRRFYSGTFKA